MRILMMTHRLPYAPNRGDRLRAYHMLHAIRESADVDLVSLVHDSQEASHASGLNDVADRVITLPVPRFRNTVRCLPALATSQPLTHVLLDSPHARGAMAALLDDHRPDVVLAYCSGMARFALEPPLAGIPLVVDLVDVDSAKWRSVADAAHWPLSAVYARETRHLARFERKLVQHAFATLVVNEREQRALRAVDPTANAIVIPNGVDAAYFSSPRAPSDRPVVVFSGVMDYAPNAQGALWLAGEIWPHVTRNRPDARLVIVGASPGPDLRALPTRDPSITVTGTVPSIREYLWDAAVAVAPLRIARGVQNKVIEAVAAGLPCVITPEVDGGVPPEIRPACHVRHAAASFADAILDLLGQSPGERRSLASRANLAGLDWPTRMKALVPILEAAAADR